MIWYMGEIDDAQCMIHYSTLLMLCCVLVEKDHLNSFGDVWPKAKIVAYSPLSPTSYAMHLCPTHFFMYASYEQYA